MHSNAILQGQPGAGINAPDVDALFAELAQLREERRTDSARELHLRGHFGAALNAAAQRERELNAQISSLQTQLALRPPVHEVQKLVAAWTAASQRAEEKHRKLNSEYDTLRLYAARLSSDLTILQQRAQGAESREEALTASAEQMRWKLHEQGIQLDELKRDTAALRTQSEEACQREAKAQCELAGARVEAQKVPALEEAVGRWKARAELGEARLQRLAAEAASSNLRVDRVAILELALTQRDAQARSTFARVQALEEENATLRRSVDSAVSRNAELQAKVQATEARARELATENEGLKARVHSAEEASQRAVALEETVARLRSHAQRNVELESALVQLQERSTQMQDERWLSERESLLGGMRELLPPEVIPSLSDASGEHQASQPTSCI